MSPSEAVCVHCGQRYEAASLSSFTVCACGSTSLGVTHDLGVAAGLVDGFELEMIPAEQPYGWESRWATVQRQVELAVNWRFDQMTPEAIVEGRSELFEAIVQCFHLMDALKVELAGGPYANEPEHVTRGNSALALIGDLANTIKHQKLDRKPRSQHRPVLGKVSGKGGQTEGWRLAFGVNHGGRVIDGTNILLSAMLEWQQHLQDWQLIDGSELFEVHLDPGESPA